MNNLVKSDIENMIYEIRGKQVMLDSDLAQLFNYETKNLNRQVQRNINRFPPEYCFQLTKEEYSYLRCQNVTSSANDNHGGRRFMPYVFTEYGITMLAGILKSDIAINMSIKIVNTFVAMRHYIGSNLLEQKYINNLVILHDTRINKIENTLSRFEEKKETSEIFYSGQVFDAYNKILEIFKSCKKELIIIDNYADNSLLNIVKRLSIKVIIITKKDNLLTNDDINKYNKQYHNLKVLFNDTFHDRYFILDSNIIYHCGTSINRMGYKTFSVTKIGDELTYKGLLEYIKKIKR